MSAIHSTKKLDAQKSRVYHQVKGHVLTRISKNNELKSCKEDVVISGIAGRFPESDSFQEFADHLMNGDDLITVSDRRWAPGLLGTPTGMGTLKDITKFDAMFFSVHAKQAEELDPQTRMLMEVAYEAIIDAGFQPSNLRGRNIGVFVAMSNSSADEGLSLENVEKSSGYLATGIPRCMAANRVSFSLDFKGPSYTLDSACSSSLTATHLALSAIRNGACEAAIVGGTNICLKLQSTYNCTKLGMLSPDSKCKVFDESANGFVRSEAIVAIFLQKSSEAKRVYATVIHSKINNDGYKKEGITYPSGQMQKRLLQEVYDEANINPADVEYVETHGTGTKAGDPQEVNSVADFFCRGRTTPLLIGSVKSNMGHSEFAAGLCGLAKVLVAIKEGVIPGNLHYKSPNPDLPGLCDGRLKVVDKNMPWNRGLVGINSFGFGGSNAHVILKPNVWEKILPSPPINEGLKLFTYSARTQEGLLTALNEMESKPYDRDLYELFREPAMSPLNTHPYRGYSILNSSEDIRQTVYCSTEKRPIWFIYPGMGTQWNEMGRDLMNFEIFKASIMRADEILKPFNIRATNLILSTDETLFHNVVNSFVGVACIQVALTNILKALNIVPDGILGHSFGELGCAYADGCFTEEQVILSAYWRGRMVKDGSLPLGAMVAVDLTWDEVINRCPTGITAACHNAQDNVTISGRADLVNDYVKVLKSEGITVKEVNSLRISFHCHYMNDVAPKLLEKLETVIPQPKPRSAKWISTSVPETRWDTSLASTCSAAYFVNNLVSPVLFHEGMLHVPKKAVTIEVAPHTMMHAIIKRTLGGDCTYLGMMKKNESDMVQYLLLGLGRLFNAGVNFSAAPLYAPVRCPIARGTTNIGSLVRWDHTRSWRTATAEDSFKSGGTSGKAQVVIEVDMSSPDSSDHYLVGHFIDGRVLYPATGYLVLAWRALARIKGKEYTTMKVAIEEVMFRRATILPKTGIATFTVNLLTNGEFDISEGGGVVATGRVYEPEFDTFQYATYDISETAQGFQLKSRDIYKELRLRGYEYGPTFQGILESDNQGIKGKLKWVGNWVSFLDTVLQFSVLSTSQRLMCLPTRLQYAFINPEMHSKILNTCEEYTDEVEGTKASIIPITNDADIGVSSSGGVEIQGLFAALAPRRPNQHNPPVYEEYHFVPFMESNCLQGRENNEQILQNYADLCVDYLLQQTRKFVNQGAEVVSNSLLLDNVINRETPEDVQKVVDIFLANTSLNPSLLRVLVEIFTNKPNKDFKINAYNCIQRNLNSLQNDSLLSALLQPRVVSTCLDIVSENITTSKIKVVEAGACHGKMFPKIIAAYNSQPLLQVECTVTDGDPQGFNQEELKAWNVKSCKWDVLTEASPPAASDAHLVVAKGMMASNPNQIHVCLNNLMTSLKDGGFILLQENTQDCCAAQFINSICDSAVSPTMREDLKNKFESLGLQLIAVKNDGILATLFLLRKVKNNNPAFSVILVEENAYDTWVEDIKKKMKDLENSRNEVVWLVAHDSPTNGITGLVNCLRLEPGGEIIRSIFNPHLDEKRKKHFKDSPEQALRTTYGDLIKNDLVKNVYSNQCWGTFRYIPMEPGEDKEMEDATVSLLTYGDISSIRWVESLQKFADCSEPPKDMYDIYYAALNFKDIMLATGNVPLTIESYEKQYIGLECVGRDKHGNRVMGVTLGSGITTRAVFKPEVVWNIPDHWTLEEAATVPNVYITAYYALILRAHLREGQSILIHCGSGGVGLAAITLALSMACEVFTTVGNKVKREFLKKYFPQLKDENIGNSRDTSFETLILKATKGRGVDVVLNSLSDEKLMASLRCVARHGHFIEIGRRDAIRNTKLGMSVLLKNITIHGITYDNVEKECFEVNSEVKRLLYEGIENGVVKPLPRRVFLYDEIEEAFRFMAAGKHVGKVVIKVRDEEPQKVIKAKPMMIKALPSVVCHPRKSYIIVGGLGGFGVELAEWLVERGARFLVLTSRTGIKPGYQSWRISVWKQLGVKVIVSTNDVSTEDGTVRLLSEASDLSPVGGIFNLALVLRDAFMENQTVENFKAVCDPKAGGTHNLDNISRKMCRELDWFVVFSSLSCGRGNAGQSNYGFGNSVMERICEIRQKDGLPGLAIQWGAIGDVGAIIENMRDNEAVISGSIPQRMKSCMDTMDRFLNQSHPVVASHVMADKQSPKNRDAASVNLLDAVSHILGVKDLKSLNPAMKLRDMGMDSIMGLEIKNTLEREFNLMLSSSDIQELSIKQLESINDSKGQSRNDSHHDTETDIITPILHYDFQKMVPTENIVHLNDLNSGNPLFIVHPIEGSTIAMKTLANKLPVPVFGIQGTARSPLTSIEDIASFYIQQMKNVQPEGPYRISGHSFGATVVIEMAIQLGDNDVENTILLDGSHKTVPTILDDYLRKEGIKEFSHKEVDALCMFMSQFMQIDYIKVHADISKYSTWSGRLERMAEILMETGRFNSQKDIEQAADIYHKRMLACYKYRPGKKLNGNVMLLKSTETFFSNEELTEDYNLSEVFTGQIRVERLEGNHDTFLLGRNATKCSSLIREALGC